MLNCNADDFLFDTFSLSDILFRHVKNEVSVHPFDMFIRQVGNSGVKFLHGKFPEYSS